MERFDRAPPWPPSLPPPPPRPPPPSPTRRSSSLMQQQCANTSRWRARAARVCTIITPAQAPRAPSSTGSVKSAMKMMEKILARASERVSLELRENVWVDVDVLMTHDVCGSGTIGIFNQEFGENAKVWDREKVVIIPNNYIFTSDE